MLFIAVKKQGGVSVLGYLLKQKNTYLQYGHLKRQCHEIAALFMLPFKETLSQDCYTLQYMAIYKETISREFYTLYGYIKRHFHEIFTLYMAI